MSYDDPTTPDLSSKYNDGICEQAYAYRSDSHINTLQYLQIVLSVCSIAMVIYLLRSEELKRLRAIVRPSLKVALI